jgi:uncharacterized repeat protein (TIGR03803 family)
MKSPALRRYALVIAAVALLAACGGSQPTIGVPGAMPQTSELTARTDGTKYTVVHNFGSGDGQNPVASLIDVRGTLYSTTLNGGSCLSYNFCGTVFSIRPSGKERVLHIFGHSTDGWNPLAGLIDVGGTFYGTTGGGGSYGLCRLHTGGEYYPCGTVFSITPSGAEKVLHSFGGKRDGLYPAASLIDVNGTLYGTTENGGAHNRCGGGCGTVFSITPSGAEKVLHNFGGGSDGAYPLASLIDVNGTLYGTTLFGGAYHRGTVFRITLSGKEKVLHSFANGVDGAYPGAGLIDVGGTLYGTTRMGGVPNCNTYGKCGTVFSITPAGTEKVLHSFGSPTDGGDPSAALVALKGTLYGTTEYGGVYYNCSGADCGTVFSITPSGAEKVLHNFGSGTDGRSPTAALIDVDGTLYGTTVGGGEYNYGTVFALTP